MKRCRCIFVRDCTYVERGICKLVRDSIVARAIWSCCVNYFPLSISWITYSEGGVIEIAHVAWNLEFDQLGSEQVVFHRGPISFVSPLSPFLTRAQSEIQNNTTSTTTLHI
jgi:hypothetical protein